MPRRALVLTLLVLGAALVPPAATAAPLTWTKATSAIDVHHDANGMSCPTATLCVVIEEDGRIAVSTNPAAATPAWATFDLPASLDGSTPARFQSVACPAAGLCIATTRLGDLFVSTDPASQASWTKSVFSAGRFYGREIDRLSCQADSPCVGYDSANREAVITQTPAGGAAGWHADEFAYSFSGDIACMAGPVCIASSGPSIVYTTNPGGGADKWTVVSNVGNLFDGLSSRDTIDSVACGGTFCLAGGHGTAGHNGGLYWSTNPTGDVTAWSSFPSFFSEVSRLACSPGGARCVAWRDDGPFIFDATNPLGGKTAWSLTNPAVNDDYIAEVSCPEVSICFAISLSGYFAAGKDNFTGGTGDPIPAPPPGTTPAPAPKPAPIPLSYPGPTFGSAPKQLDPGGATMSIVIESASDAQATVRMLSNQPIVEISAKQKKRIQTFGTAKATLKAGVAKKVKVKLTRKAQSYFRRHASVKVKIAVTATTPAGVTKTTSRTATIKRARKQAKR